MARQMSAASPGALLQTIRAQGGLTRQQLLTRTGMARSTLSERLDSLERAGLIYESQQLSSTGGRPASVVAFDDRDRVVLTIDIGHHRATVEVCDHEGEALLTETLERDKSGLPELLENLARAGELLLAQAEGKRLAGVGLAIPAPVNSHTGTRQSSVALPDADFPFVELLAQRFGVDVAVENDARALTIGAALEVPPLADGDVLIGVKFSTGVGIGLYTGHHILSGSAGAAGDLGHLTITPGYGPECTCGRVGCLAAYVSGRAIVRDLARSDVRHVGDIARLFDAGDAEVVPVVERAAHVLGLHLGGFVQVTNPAYVFFGGFLGRRPAITEHTVAAIRTRLSHRVDGPAEYRVVHGDHTTARGLVAMVLDQAFSPDQVDRLVRRSTAR
ncbi:MAG TPA: ROK family transcriptional regulator [Arachnia sp.]|nr:ROK family transcriptional regulator [Arachnia sp.]